MKFSTPPCLGLAVLAGVSLLSSASAVVIIDSVAIGDTGNAAQSAANRSHSFSGGDGYGAVSYAYHIATNETTIADYAVFLNAVAATDTYSLYNTLMTTTEINGITRTGVSGSFAYSVNPGSGNRPVTYVSWFDAARFSNWLHHGQPTGAQGNSTTEDGAYTLLGAVNGVAVSKNEGALAWIPSENEWYKATYYDPNQGGAGVGGYWLHANQSNALPGNTLGVAGSANYFDGDFVGYPAQALTNVGAYGANSASAYGTNDQAGNVGEWNDAVMAGSTRGWRGGSWYNGDSDLASYSRSSSVPSDSFSGLGFRVAVVPEPTSVFLTMLTGAVMLIRRKR